MAGYETSADIYAILSILLHLSEADQGALASGFDGI